MPPHDFAGVFSVLADPQPFGEGAGHRLTVTLTGRRFTIECDQHCATRTGRYAEHPERLEGAGYRIRRIAQTPKRQLHCEPIDGANTGSWTAEDASGPDR
jgi:hypothetical protein